MKSTLGTQAQLTQIRRQLIRLPLLLFTLVAGSHLKASDVMFILDASGSMRQTTDDGVVRIDAAKQAFTPLTETFSNEEVSLMIFGHRKSPKQAGACQDIEVAIPFGPMAPDQFKSRVNSVQALGNTPLADSLLRAKDELLGLDRDSQKAIIVLTDGNETCGGDPASVAAMLAELGINVKVHVVGFAVNPDEEEQLLSIAAAGGGNYVAAKNAKELKEVLPEIVKTAMLKTETTELERQQVFKDSFDGESLGSEWEVLRPDDSRYAIVDGSLMVLTQHVAPWEDNENIANFIQTKEPISARDYEVAATVSLKRTMQHQGGSILLYQDSENYLELSAFSNEHGYNLKRVLRFTKVVQGKGALFTYENGIGAAEAPEVFEMKIVKMGVIYSAYVKLLIEGNDAPVWVSIGRHGAPGLSAPRLALKAANGREKDFGQEKIAEAEVTFDDVSITSSVWETKIIGEEASEASYTTLFQNKDEFSNEFTVANEEDSHWALDRGLTIVSKYGVFGDQENPVKNIALLNRELPEGDYDVEVQASFRLTSQMPQMGIALYQDDQNLLLLGRYGKEHGYNVRRTDVFRKFTGGTDSPIETEVNRFAAETEPMTHLFRIEKRGRTYTGKIYTLNEQTGEYEWITVGEQTVLKFDPKLALIAHNLSTRDFENNLTHEVVVRFEKLTIIPK